MTVLQNHKPVKAVPAASIMVVRDGMEGLEVLTVQRTASMRFAGGMLVFPGGRVDQADRASTPADKGRARPSCLQSADFAYRLAALRELFEETGLLVASEAEFQRPVREFRRLRLAQRYRQRIHNDAISFFQFLRRAGLSVDLSAMVPFAHWITPKLSPKRFDTRFYLVAAPKGQHASADGIENDSLSWHRPSDLLAAWDAGEQPLMLPTRLNLLKLSKSQTVAQALMHAKRTKVIPLTPEIVGADARQLEIPEEAGFGITKVTHHDLDSSELGLISDAVRDALKLKG